MFEINEVKNFFLKRRLFIITNYDDQLYRLLPILIMLKANLDRSGSSIPPNLVVYAPFPKKIVKFLGKAMTSEDWHAALKRGWVHVACRRNYFEKSWRNNENQWFNEFIPAYDKVTSLDKHHTLLPDNYFEKAAENAHEICREVSSRSEESGIEDFSLFLKSLDAHNSEGVQYFRGPFVEIRDRTLTEDGYDGVKAPTMLFQYFLNDFKQAEEYGYDDLLIPPIYIDVARHILGAEDLAICSGDSPMSIFAGTELEEYLLDQEEKIQNSSFLEAAIEALSILAEQGGSTEILSRQASLERRVEFFAKYFREGVWLLL
jgi:hypothetical protein